MTTRRAALLLALTALATLTGCGGAEPDAATPSRRLIVVVDAPAARSLRAPGTGDAHDDQAFADVRAEAFERAKAEVLAASPPGAVTVLRRYTHLPVLLVEASGPDAAAALAAQPGVVGVYEDAASEASLAESLPLVGQPAAAAAGFTGQGKTVAVLDTGVDWRQPAFGTCPAPGAPGCRVRYAADFAPDDGALDADGHGTNVAGIVAGVAPGAGIVALDVFDGKYAYTSDVVAAIDWCVAHREAYDLVAINLSLGTGGSSTPCGGDAFAPAVRAASEAGIAVVAAAGNNAYLDRIMAPACAPGAVSVGAVYDAKLGPVTWSTPRCTDPATAPDQVVCFSNTAPFLSLLAPGAFITAAGSTYAGTSQATPHVAGAVAVVRSAFPWMTSAQAVARLQETGKPVLDPRTGRATPRLDLAAAVEGASCHASFQPGAVRFDPQGGTVEVAITADAGCAWTAAPPGWLAVDPPSGTGSALVRLSAGPAATARSGTLALGGASLPLGQAADDLGPTGAVAVVGGAVTRLPRVRLALRAADASGVAGMCLSNGPACATRGWEPFAATREWTLGPGAAGARTVRAWFRDGAGNVSGPFPASVVLDDVPPVDGTVVARSLDGGVALSFTGFRDDLSGVAGYRVVEGQGAAPASCGGGTLLYAGSAPAFTHAGFAAGSVHAYRVCAVDAAGNVSRGVAVVGRAAGRHQPRSVPRP